MEIDGFLEMNTPVIFIGLALIFIVAKIMLEKRLAPMDASGDERGLGDLAFTMNCSVYDLFQNAGADWNFSKEKIDRDFKNYVRSNQIPSYLHDYLHRSDRPAEKTYQELLYAGGRPPYL